MEGIQPKVLLFDIGGVCVKSPFQIILDYEISLGIPPGWINYSISKSGPTGFWQRIERGEIPMDDAFFDGFTRDLHVQQLWEDFYTAQQAKDPQRRLAKEEIPPLPRIDGKWLFNEMMAGADAPDPWMYPALQKLRASGKYILAALSNTVIFPPGHKLHREDFFDEPVRQIFDLFISSAHVGIRKPDPEIYRLALEKLNAFARENAHDPRHRGKGWENGISPKDVVFLDDIGENLKEARRQGFNTIKVHLGRTYEAVEELEKITGLSLEGPHPKIPIKPKYGKPRAKI
ncbi:Acyl-CoA dehydrogenase family member 10 [Trichoderma ghanense]|uniref:Acyl-CoA dehydrogenase family member 10 n=1 Tax=Trichoderma ghanense TaxID=65468 RepID=A0ABY2HA80_9HYPO